MQGERIEKERAQLKRQQEAEEAARIQAEEAEEEDAPIYRKPRTTFLHLLSLPPCETFSPTRSDTTSCSTCRPPSNPPHRTRGQRLYQTQDASKGGIDAVPEQKQRGQGEEEEGEGEEDPREGGAVGASEVADVGDEIT